MSDAIKIPRQAAADELIRKLIRAGDLSPAKQHDPEAIAQAIARMKNILRGRRPENLFSGVGARSSIDFH
jgi:hypothetical protein